MFKRIFPKNGFQELGFGTAAGTRPGERMMNADGSMNIIRRNTLPFDNLYFHLIRMSWSSFFASVLLIFVFANTVFASIYCCIGIEQLAGAVSGSFWENFLQGYFFSSQTLTTVGYGAISPKGLGANIVASIESLAGLLSFALISGLMYGRFSRPRIHIEFSQNLLISPFREGQALMFRMVNARRSELIEVEAAVLMSYNETSDDGSVARRYIPLELQLKKITFFALTWTIVHPLDEKSPLAGRTPEEIEAIQPEFVVIVKGIDEAYEQQVHTRRSYIFEDIVWNARFKPFLMRDGRGRQTVLTEAIGDFEKLG